MANNQFITPLNKTQSQQIRLALALALILILLFLYLMSNYSPLISSPDSDFLTPNLDTLNQISLPAATNSSVPEFSLPDITVSPQN